MSRTRSRFQAPTAPQGSTPPLAESLAAARVETLNSGSSPSVSARMPCAHPRLKLSRHMTDSEVRATSVAGPGRTASRRKMPWPEKWSSFICGRRMKSLSSIEPGSCAPPVFSSPPCSLSPRVAERPSVIRTISRGRLHPLPPHRAREGGRVRASNIFRKNIDDLCQECHAASLEDNINHRVGIRPSMKVPEDLHLNENGEYPASPVMPPRRVCKH